MIATRNLTVYTTTDGVDFTNESEAVRHQAVIDAEALIDTFVESKGLDNPASANRTRNLVREYVAFAAAVA